MSDQVFINAAEPVFGIQMGKVSVRVHSRDQCEGREIPCCIHSPSDHPMRSWPLNWRSDTGVMERTCPHGTGHPDPDHMAYVLSLTPEHECIDEWVRREYPNGNFWLSDDEKCQYPHLEWQAIHSCCGCCIPKENECG